MTDKNPREGVVSKNNIFPRSRPVGCRSLNNRHFPQQNKIDESNRGLILTWKIPNFTISPTPLVCVNGAPFTFGFRSCGSVESVCFQAWIIFRYLVCMLLLLVPCYESLCARWNWSIMPTAAESVCSFASFHLLFHFRFYLFIYTFIYLILYLIEKTDEEGAFRWTGKAKAESQNKTWSLNLEPW